MAAATPGRKTYPLSDRSGGPGLRYEVVDLSSTDYTPTGGLFRGFHVGATGGAVVVQDVTGTNFTFSGCVIGSTYSYGGQKIIRTGTVSTLLIAILD